MNQTAAYILGRLFLQRFLKCSPPFRFSGWYMDKKNVVKKISRSDDFSTSALQNGVFWVTRVSARLSRPYDGNPKPVGSTHSHICTHHLTLQTFVLPNLLIVHQNLKYEKHGELFSLPKCHFRFLSQIDILATNYLCDGGQKSAKIFLR